MWGYVSPIFGDPPSCPDTSYPCVTLGVRPTGLCACLVHMRSGRGRCYQNPDGVIIGYVSYQTRLPLPGFTEEVRRGRHTNRACATGANARPRRFFVRDCAFRLCTCTVHALNASSSCSSWERQLSPGELQEPASLCSSSTPNSSGHRGNLFSSLG